MKKSIIVFSAIVMFAIVSVSCSKSDECDILSVSDASKPWVRDGKNNFEGTYGKDDDVSKLNLTIKVSPKASYSPKGPYNFSSGNVTVTVTAQSGETQKFNLKVK